MNSKLCVITTLVTKRRPNTTIDTCNTTHTHAEQARSGKVRYTTLITSNNLSWMIKKAKPSLRSAKKGSITRLQYLSAPKTTSMEKLYFSISFSRLKIHIYLKVVGAE